MAIDWTHWLLFLPAGLILNLSPGPDLFYVVGTSLANGRKVGVAAALGIAFGALFHVCAAAFGIAVLLRTSPWAFFVMKWVGALYLAWLGVNAIRGAHGVAGQIERKAVSTFQAFRQGALVDVMNPKSAIFFLAFLPQFIQPGAGSVAGQTIILGVIVILIGLVIESAAALGAAQLTQTLRKRPALTAWLDRIFGGVLIGLGARLAFQQRV